MISPEDIFDLTQASARTLPVADDFNVKLFGTVEGWLEIDYVIPDNGKTKMKNKKTKGEISCE